MKELIIIGAGGMGREIFNLATCCKGYNSNYTIKGYLDDWSDALNAFKGYPPVIGTIDNYTVSENDVFICSLGNIQNKIKAVQKILKKGGEFISLIHPDSSVAPDATIGSGCIILQDVRLGSVSTIGDFVLIQNSAIIGHDVKIGNYSRIDNFVVCVGGVTIEDEVTIHTSAVINQKVSIGHGATIGALSFVIRKVKENTTVFGNPAITLK